MNSSHIVSENIRLIREIKGYKQEYMAMRLDMTQSGYAKLESGKTSITIKRLKDISDILEVDISDLLHNGEKNYYYPENNHIANAHQNVESFYYERKEIYEKLIKKQEVEITFLRNLLEKKQ